MWFFTILVAASVLWLLWTINQNTGDSLDKQTAILNELMKLNKAIEEFNKPPIAIPPAQAQTIKSTVNLININKAGIDQLTTLQGIGKSTAQKIIDSRPYNNITALTEVQGINKELLDKISSMLEC
mgnify:CR=1 FL=1